LPSFDFEMLQQTDLCLPNIASVRIAWIRVFTWKGVKEWFRVG